MACLQPIAERENGGNKEMRSKEGRKFGSCERKRQMKRIRRKAKWKYIKEGRKKDK